MSTRQLVIKTGVVKRWVPRRNYCLEVKYRTLISESSFINYAIMIEHLLLGIMRRSLTWPMLAFSCPHIQWLMLYSVCSFRATISLSYTARRLAGTWDVIVRIDAILRVFLNTRLYEPHFLPTVNLTWAPFDQWTLIFLARSAGLQPTERSDFIRKRS